MNRASLDRESLDRVSGSNKILKIRKNFKKYITPEYTFKLFFILF